MKNFATVKKIAIVSLAALFIITTLFTAAVAFLDNSKTPSANSDVEISIPIAGGDETSQESTEKEVIPETKVLLVDASGSMKNNIFASAGYDSVQKFGDYLGQAGGNSLIYTNIVRTLDMGVQIVGVVTDLESYPSSDVDAIAGKSYENVSLTFYLPADVDANAVKEYQTNWSNALDNTNSTLVFVNADGSKLVVFDAYEEVKEEEQIATETEEKEDSNIVVKVDTEATSGDSISFRTLVLILGTMIDLFCIFGIIMIAMFARSDKSGKEKDVPEEIEKAFELPVALDGSASVSDEYDDMVKYAEKLNVSDVWRFAENVDKISTIKAKSTPAGGNTCGWKCLKEMSDAGLSDIAIMTDFGFNDDASVADGISFNHITMIVPARISVNDEIKQKVCGMCKSYKVIKM